MSHGAEILATVQNTTADYFGEKGEGMVRVEVDIQSQFPSTQYAPMVEAAMQQCPELTPMLLTVSEEISTTVVGDDGKVASRLRQQGPNQGGRHAPAGCGLLATKAVKEIKHRMIEVEEDLGWHRFVAGEDGRRDISTFGASSFADNIFAWMPYDGVRRFLKIVRDVGARSGYL